MRACGLQAVACKPGTASRGLPVVDYDYFWLLLIPLDRLMDAGAPLDLFDPGPTYKDGRYARPTEAARTSRQG